MPKKTCRVGLIGTRFMGKAHANAFGQAPRFFDLPQDVKLLSVAGKDVEKTRSFAHRWNIERPMKRWEDLIGDPDIDLVDIATPNFLHRAPALAALAAGKHVVCEKPLAPNLAEARQMKDAARKSKGQTFVWFNYRRCPAVAFAHKLVASGRLGAIRHIRAHYLQSWAGPKTPLLWRFKKKLAGSGAHGDLNAHIVDMARFVSGDEVKVVHGAIAKTFIKEREIPGSKKMGRSNVDDSFLFMAEMKNGATASFEASRLAHGHLNDNHFEINGQLGSLRFSFEDMNVLEIFDARDKKNVAGWRRVLCTDPQEHPWFDAWWPDAHLLGYEHGFTNQVADMMMALAGKKPVVPLPNFDDAYQTQRVLEAAMASAAQGCRVKMSEIK